MDVGKVTDVFRQYENTLKLHRTQQVNVQVNRTSCAWGSVARGMQVGATHPIRIRTSPLGIFKISNMLISQLTCDNLPHARVASAKPPWLETTHCEKCMYMQYVGCGVNTAHYSNKDALYAYACMYVIKHYI
jgi:hypothetical protein